MIPNSGWLLEELNEALQHAAWHMVMFANRPSSHWCELELGQIEASHGHWALRVTSQLRR